VKPSLIADIEAILEETGVNPNNVEMEITESILLDDVDRSIMVLEKLKALGLKLSLDDFGTGYSSLTYLRSFPIDVVKIDRSFVDGIGDDPDNAAIVRSVVELAKTLGLTCIAEDRRPMTIWPRFAISGATSAQLPDRPAAVGGGCRSG
jgi:EAL domain-containing protein (putative c-di-GMP-specific phosphodiesterase class I)